jgi:hypothetical protein
MSPTLRVGPAANIAQAPCRRQPNLLSDVHVVRRLTVVDQVDSYLLANGDLKNEGALLAVQLEEAIAHLHRHLALDGDGRQAVMG